MARVVLRPLTFDLLIVFLSTICVLAAASGSARMPSQSQRDRETLRQFSAMGLRGGSHLQVQNSKGVDPEFGVRSWLT